MRKRAALLAISTTVSGLVAQAPTRDSVCGRIERQADLRIVRVWGTPEQRGYAHGKLLAAEVAKLVRLEFASRFARKARRLERLRAELDERITYPDDVRAEITALFEGVRDAGVDLDMPEFDRPIDLRDLLLLNALDVLWPMACSGATVWGAAALGGGVLTSRNFDWPYSGPHLVDETVLLVQHPHRGVAFAAVTWPGYVGCPTGVSEHGIAVFLHIGNAVPELARRTPSTPLACAMRRILESGSAANAAELARTELGRAKPLVGYVARVVLPEIPADGSPPSHVFEVDSRRVIERAPEPCRIVTNHFLAREDVIGVALDSRRRFTTLKRELAAARDTGDHKLSTPEAWKLLGAVARDHRFAIGSTLSSLVFRADPWVFELGIGTPHERRKLTPAPTSKRRYALDKKTLFADPR